MVDGPITDMQVVSQLKQIQEQLAVLETSYANMTRTYYDMFYNNNPMDITLQIYDDEGILKTIIVPNRAKSSAYTMVNNGSPKGVVEAPLGAILMDTSSGNLWYKYEQTGTTGWYQIASEVHLSQNYLKINGDGNLLQKLNANNITFGILNAVHGGLGTDASQINGILKMVPATESTPAYVTKAVEGSDYLSKDTLAGMIVYFPIDRVPAGFLVCNGAMYEREYYQALWNYLTNNGTNLAPFDGFEYTDTMFSIPNLENLFIRCTTNFVERHPMTKQDCGVPNFKGTWSMELPGGKANVTNFTGAVQIVLDEDKNYKQVDGKSSAPAGSYDYLIEVNPQNYNEICEAIYQDDLDEVRVNNIALVPAIKY